MTEKFTDLMIDFETLGLRPHSKTMQLGYVFFNRVGSSKMVGSSRFFDLEEQEALGRTELKSTVTFWENQPAQLYQKMQSGDNSVREVLEAFTRAHAKYAKPSTWIWSQGAKFDQPILDALFDHVPDLKDPIDYRRSRCSRTLGALFPDPKHWHTAQQAHDAKSDCIAQVRTVRSIFQELEELKNGKILPEG